MFNSVIAFPPHCFLINLAGGRRLLIITATINHLLILLISEISADKPIGEVATQYFALALLTTSKEKAGIERALGGNGYERNGFNSTDVWIRYVSTVAAQEALDALFRDYATSDIVEKNASIAIGLTIEAFTRMRSVLLLNEDKAELSRLGSDEWFAISTGRIELLREVEGTLVEKIRTELADQVQSRVESLVLNVTVFVVVLLAMILVTVFFFLELRKREKHEIATEKFLPSDFMEILGSKNIEQLYLGQRKACDLTVLFLDVRNFSGITESMTDEEAFDWLNQFMAVLAPCVLCNGGFIDKYVGDSIMAVFHDPDSAMNAAVMMKKAVNHLNRFQRARASERELLPVEYKIGIGIHNASVIAGVVGHDLRRAVTIVSDGVNLASRLEGLTKHYGVTIIVSARCISRCENVPPAHRLLGLASVKGKTSALHVYDCYAGDPPSLRRYKERTKKSVEEAHSAFIAGNFDLCISLCKAILCEYPPDLAPQFGDAMDVVTRLRLAKRAADLDREGDLPDPWLGIDRFISK